MVSVGDSFFELMLTPLRGTPGQRYLAELPNSSMPKHVRFRKHSEVLVESDGSGGFTVSRLPWYRSPRQILFAVGDLLGALNP